MKPDKDINIPPAITSPRDKVNAAAVDPVCSMTVYSDTASGFYEYKGKTNYFYSTHCLDKFRSDPEHFLSKSTEPRASQPVGIGLNQNPPLNRVGWRLSVRQYLPEGVIKRVTRSGSSKRMNGCTV